MPWDLFVECFFESFAGFPSVSLEERFRAEKYINIHKFAMFSRSQGLQNEVKMARKRAERRRRSREGAKREQRGGERALRSVPGAFRGAPGIPGGASVERAACFDVPSRPRVSEGFGPKSEEKC